MRAIDAAGPSSPRSSARLRGVGGVDRAHGLQRAPGGRQRDHEHERRGAARAGAGRSGSGAAASGAWRSRKRRARGDEARAQQRRHRVAGDVPGPVDRRVHAEDEHDDRQRRQPDALGVPGQSQRAAAHPQHARRGREERRHDQQREPDARPSRGRRAPGRDSCARAGRRRGWRGTPAAAARTRRRRRRSARGCRGSSTPPASSGRAPTRCRAGGSGCCRAAPPRGRWPASRPWRPGRRCRPARWRAAGSRRRGPRRA